ncbi:nucleotidyltransferase family protein [Bradyrhizobium erythrophlei]|uniref:CBS domain-containing protein n=1 Tax=Bradyrhizobium erythrophlei TaxID=1437360 RepID=A0A1M7UHF5_9BRAD|nr:nucleotidyltransferase family protein [Bradyrhizobium erythrophlei]SHN82419.1 CBS domain-containing protein [Bradyrhizobium erythrophlei]
MDSSWKKAVVAPEQTMEDALKAINAGGLRIAFVVSAAGKILGTVSDGDTRRALIARVLLTDSVTRVMNPNPRTLPPTADRELVLSIMEQHDLLVIPIVNDQNEVLGVHVHRELTQPHSRNNLVFIMAGGFGTRLHPLTLSCPKPMLEVDGKPILERTIERFIAAGFLRFAISVHYLPDMIKSHFGDGSRWDAKISYIEEKEPLGTAGALGLLERREGQPLIVINGDVVTDVDVPALLAFHTKTEAALTMCVREHDIQVPYGVVKTDGADVLDVVEKPTHKFFVNAGIYVLSPALLNSVAPNVRLDMPDLIRRAISDRKLVKMFPIHERWADIGRFDDFNRAVAGSIGRI